MAGTEELEALVQTFIERPAALRLQQLLAEGLITASDRDLFLVSARKYHEAAFAHYAEYDPAVRHELVKALLVDYQQELGRLLDEMAARRRPRAIETRGGFLRKLWHRNR
ncbi:hypothetical protein VSH64_36235 [Amycolatopsis rhabdoformis]|uniref:Uncharacterized protein n=1 Tax=Amycolatopsis rhabdoformis TaxID=1448059 RepID=A0ABZ1I452_9PSEU|nr:hypothetical protein [Amycolatopsis rhabdoformis]WSE28249.1 hypothetical protein VSH64_36235 [Amycolatopsis rhabdoformis]